jgi:predicted nucleotidyltransferase
MATANDRIVRATAETLQEIAGLLDIGLTLGVVFGSRARDDFTTESDVDILLVSPDFEGVAFAERSQYLYLQWPYESLPAPEFLCFTPDEFERRRESSVPTIVNTVLNEGVVIIGDDR